MLYCLARLRCLVHYALVDICNSPCLLPCQLSSTHTTPPKSASFGFICNIAKAGIESRSWWPKVIGVRYHLESQIVRNSWNLPSAQQDSVGGTVLYIWDISKLWNVFGLEETSLVIRFHPPARDRSGVKEHCCVLYGPSMFQGLFSSFLFWFLR